MKKLFMFALCALSLGMVSCDKEKGEDEGNGLLASISDNQMVINGKVYSFGMEGYAMVDGEFCVVDIQGGDENSFAGGYIQGNYLNKTVDLANLNIEVFGMCINAETYSVSAADVISYTVDLYKDEEGVRSKVGQNVDWDAPYDEKSCFTSGKLTSSYKNGRVTINIEGTLTTGVSMAIKINYPTNKEVRPD